MRNAPIVLMLAVLLPVTASAQDTTQAAPRRPIPPGMIGMRLGTPRTAFADSSCARNESGEEWCSPLPFQRLLIRDRAVVALEVPINIVAPDSLPGDTVWHRYLIPRAMRFFGAPDSSHTADGRTTLWWNWDGVHGPRRSRVVGGAVTDSAATRVETIFRIECAPGAALAACAAWDPPRPTARP